MDRKLWKYTLLLAIVLVLAAGLLDSARDPANSLLARAYISAVHIYQKVSRPSLSRFVRCRYKPSCSDYSIEAVKRYGIVKGLGMSAKRIFSCRGNVPMGTADPVR
ncbi:MAG: membrane protein insertion efficiency factor YidD [Nitrospirota bacterium]